MSRKGKIVDRELAINQTHPATITLKKQAIRIPYFKGKTMKRLLIAMLAFVLVGCVQHPAPPVSQKTIGMANPASVYCHEKGGKSQSVQTSAGARADCLLPGGEKIDEWELYRRYHK